MKINKGLFVPGIGWSAIVVTVRGEETDELPMRLVRLQWAYIALYLEIDRALLILLNRLEATGERPFRLKELEGAATHVFGSFVRVVQARARVDSALAGLGGDEQAIWDGIAKVQKLDALVGGVDKKVEALRHITDRRVQEASSAQAWRSARSLGLLATLGLVSLAVASVGYFFGGVSDGGNEQFSRWLIFISAGVLALCIWWVVFYLRPRRHQPPPELVGPLIKAHPAESSARRPAGSRTTRSAPAAPLSPPGPGQ